MNLEPPKMPPQPEGEIPKPVEAPPSPANLGVEGVPREEITPPEQKEQPEVRIPGSDLVVPQESQLKNNPDKQAELENPGNILTGEEEVHTPEQADRLYRLVIEMGMKK